MYTVYCHTDFISFYLCKNFNTIPDATQALDNWINANKHTNMTGYVFDNRTGEIVYDPILVLD